MNKKTKTAIAVGVVAVAGYLIYRQSQKNKPFANFTRTLRTAPVDAVREIRAVCLKSPVNGGTYSGAKTGGKIAYECCGTGVFAYQKSDVPCSDTKGSTATTSLTF
jgi:hypothetical protein